MHALSRTPVSGRGDRFNSNRLAVPGDGARRARATMPSIGPLGSGTRKGPAHGALRGDAHGASQGRGDPVRAGRMARPGFTSCGGGFGSASGASYDPPCGGPFLDGDWPCVLLGSTIVRSATTRTL